MVIVLLLIVAIVCLLIGVIGALKHGEKRDIFQRVTTRNFQRVLSMFL